MAVSRRAIKASGSFTTSRSTLLVDLQQQKDREDQLAKQQAAEEKAAQTQAWNSKVDELKGLAQNLLDGQMTAKEYQNAVEDAKSQFSDKAGLLDSNFRSVIRASDTQRYNDYVNGSISFSDWKSYSQDRQADKSGDLDHLGQLQSQAQRHEDNNTFNQYVKGEIPFSEWQKYVQGRQSAGLNPDDIQHLGTLDTQARVNESRAEDRRAQIAYQGGALNGDQYIQYLQGRVQSAQDPTDLNNLRTELTGVQKNEFVKQVNAVDDGVNSGRFGLGDAALQLHSLLDKTNDEGLKAQVLNKIASYQKAGAAQVGAALRAKDDAAEKMYTTAEANFSKTKTEAFTAARAGEDPTALMRNMNQAWSDLIHGVQIASDMHSQATPEGQQRIAYFQQLLQGADKARSQGMYDLLTTAAQHASQTVGAKDTNPFAATSAEAKTLLTGIQDPIFQQSERQSGFNRANQIINDATKNYFESEAGRNAETFVQNRAQDVLQNGNAQKQIADWGRLNGIAVDPKDPNTIVAALRAALVRDPSTVASWFAGSDGKLTIPGMTNTDDFTKQWNSFSGGLTGLQDLHKTVFDTPTRTGLSMYQNALSATYNPHFYDVAASGQLPMEQIGPDAGKKSVYQNEQEFRGDQALKNTEDLAKKNDASAPYDAGRMFTAQARKEENAPVATAQAPTGPTPPTGPDYATTNPLEFGKTVAAAGQPGFQVQTPGEDQQTTGGMGAGPVAANHPDNAAFNDPFIREQQTGDALASQEAVLPAMEPSTNVTEFQPNPDTADRFTQTAADQSNSTQGDAGAGTGGTSDANLSQ